MPSTSTTPPSSRQQESDKYLNWFREFGMAMSLEGIKMPKDLSDVNAVYEGIVSKIKEAEQRGREEVLKVARESIVGLPNDAWNECEQGKYQALSSLLSHFNHNKE